MEIATATTVPSTAIDTQPVLLNVSCTNVMPGFSLDMSRIW
jgi:hypothetical protein